MPGGIDKTERQLNLISALLKSRQGLVWSDILDINGFDDNTSEKSRQRRLERDLHDLAAIGLNVERIPEDKMRLRWAIHRDSALLPSLGLSGEQRVLLFRIGMAYVDAQGALGRHLSTALMKLQAGAGRGRLPVEPPPDVIRRSLERLPGEASTLQAVVDAFLNRRRVTFDYRSQNGTKKRVVAPWALICRRGGWYLVGHDESADAERTFRLSRVRGKVRVCNPRAKGPEYEVPSGFDPERSFSSQPFGGGDGAYTNVKIAFDAEVAFAVLNEFEGTYKFTRRPDGGVVMHIPQAWPGEVFRYVGEFPGHWSVQAPDGLRQVIVERLKGALKMAQGAAP